MKTYNRRPGGLAKMITYTKNLREARRKAGQCIQCGIKAERLRCARCSEKLNAYRRTPDNRARERIYQRKYRTSTRYVQWSEATNDERNARRRELRASKKSEAGQAIEAAKTDATRLRKDNSALNAFLYRKAS